MKSYGSGAQVKLPGSAPDKPNIYSFDTTYDDMFKDLSRKDCNLYPAPPFPPFFNFSLRTKETQTSWVGQEFAYLTFDIPARTLN